MKLHLGCGNDYREGYINCDISREVKHDRIVDLEKKLPFRDNSVSEIIINHVLEHFQKPMNILKELYRVSRNNAIIRIRVPYFSHESAFSAIDHYGFFSYTTFDFLDKNHLGHWQGQGLGDFEVIGKRLKWRKGLGFSNGYLG